MTNVVDKKKPILVSYRPALVRVFPGRSMITPLDTIGPPIEALPLSPAILHIEGSEDAPPVPSFLTHGHAAKEATPEAASRLDRIATAVLAPLYFRSATPPATALFLGLVVFGVWLGYFAIPAAREAAPLSSWKGAAYLSILLPASIFASCLILALGRSLGCACEFVVAKLTGRGSAA